LALLIREDNSAVGLRVCHGNVKGYAAKRDAESVPPGAPGLALFETWDLPTNFASRNSFTTLYLLLL